MSIAAVQSTSPNASSPAVGATATAAPANVDAFLQLLVAELKNQDPTKPLDPTQTVTQLATFSSVEQAVKTNALLASLDASSALSQAAALVGHTVSSADGSVSGVVTSVTTQDSGLVAQLSNGQSLALATGVSVS